MRRLGLTFRDLFRARAAQGAGKGKSPRPPRLEALEDRFLPATSSGLIAGTVFSDSNANLVRDLGERVVPGVVVGLSGTTTQGVAVNTTTTTDGNGEYTFQNVQPGQYSVAAAGLPGFLNSGAGGVAVTLNAGDSLTQDLAVGGMDPSSISLRQLLNTSQDSDFPFGTPGAGAVSVSTRSNDAPTVLAQIADVSVAKNAGNTILDLAGNFTDPDIGNSQVVLHTSAGDINLTMLDKDAPRSVENFINYVNDHKYDSTFFHRLATGFVLQGGGFTFNNDPTTGKGTIGTVVADPSVQNEFMNSNLTGTVAMAKLGTDPNSATDQFFFNLADNSGNLDKQNGGFTVFAKVTSPADMAVVTKLTASPFQVTNESTFNSAFDTLPLANYTGTNFPVDTTAANYAMITSAEVVSRPESLTYSVVSNSNPGLVATTIIHNRLTLAYTPNQTGTATITVRATDQFGATVDQTFNVKVG
jgi:cyclophilin family peptidyl-prolyl cis-trans isomerase